MKNSTAPTKVVVLTRETFSISPVVGRTTAASAEIPNATEPNRLKPAVHHSRVLGVPLIRTARNAITLDRS